MCGVFSFGMERTPARLSEIAVKFNAHSLRSSTEKRKRKIQIASIKELNSPTLRIATRLPEELRVRRYG
jgi:hypothetical protein